MRRVTGGWEIMVSMGDGSEERISITTGDSTVSGAYARPADPAASVVIAHGAGAGMDHPFLRGFSDAMNGAGFATLRFNFDYAEQGKRMPDRAPKAIATWRAAMGEAIARSEGEPVWACGKSFGGRMASMAVAEGMPAAGLVFLGYPLHPPGKPEKIRDEHLYGLTVPMLFLQGRRDTFATGDLLDRVVERIPSGTLEWLDGADHSFAVAGRKRTQEEIAAGLVPSVTEFIRAGGVYTAPR
ncbi:alpha/beta hydrolase [Okibacterium endophyticum]